MISLPVSLSCCCVINWTNRQTFKIKLFFKWSQKTLKALSQWHHIQLFCLSWLLQTTIKKHKRPSWTHVLSAGSRGSSKARKSGPALIRPSLSSLRLEGAASWIQREAQALISSELRGGGCVSGFCPSVLLCMVECELHAGSLSPCSAFSSESAVFVMQGCRGVQPCLTCAQNFVASLNL